MASNTEKVDHLTPGELEEGRGNGHIDKTSQSTNGTNTPTTTKHVHHHHHHNPLRKSKHAAREKRRKREEARLKGKLPSAMYNDETDIHKLRKKLILKNEIIAATAEFCGTFLFLFFSFGIATQAGQQRLSNSSSQQTQSNTTGSLDTGALLYSSLGFGFSLAVNAWVFFRISGGLFNPAVTLGLYLCGALTWYRSITLFIVQFIAAIAAAGIAQLVIPGGINVRTKLGAGCTIAQGWIIEMFCTAMLMFAIYMLAGEKHKATFLAPVGIGLALFLCEMFATGLTGGSLNPARTLGPDVIAAAFDGTTWIYYTAPFVGTAIAASVYWALKVSRYETANEGQDGDETAQALVLRDTKGNITGAVERVDLDRAPDIPGVAGEQAGLSRNPSVTSFGDPNNPAASAANLPAGAPQAVQAAVAAGGGHVAQPGITVEDTDPRDFSPAPASTERRDFSPAPANTERRGSIASVVSVGPPATMKDLDVSKPADADELA